VTGREREPRERDWWACRSAATKKVAEAAEGKKASGFRHPASGKKNAARKQQTADRKQ